MSQNKDVPGTRPSLRARIIKPLHLLQQKVGNGKIDPQKILRSQAVIERFEIDFAPLANQYLEDLQKAAATAREATVSKTSDPEPISRSLTDPLVHLKGNAGMFDYPLLCDVSSSLLTFIEGEGNINPDSLDVIDGYIRVLGIIVTTNLRGDGGEKGQRLKSELEEATRRYHRRKDSAPVENINNDNFYVDL